ncbi:Protein of unknown function [Ferrimonas marina]|uniref:Antitoxin Xre/MbcA/ParS-like toxin-binding domain-containing protein n=2 Tax=Ferrimonas marina TaxID=299255 RepID=A0A1M5U4E7_9GAMM|nr:Protein of unknown function [Ferrimonas marina]
MGMAQQQAAVGVLERWGLPPAKAAEVSQGVAEGALGREQRAALILQIDSHLADLFENPDNRFGFMAMPNHNPFFEGRSPLSVISSGLDEDLEGVARRIATLAGQGSGLW